MYKCIKEFTLEKCDDDGFTIEGEYTTIEEGSIWNVPEDENYRLIGGEIRLEEDKPDEINWIEITEETLKEHFERIDKLKEFYGAVSLSARVSFAINTKDKETAENIVFEDIEGLEIVLKDGSKLEITELNWDLINEAERGNVRELNIDDFEIYEEKQS